MQLSEHFSLAELTTSDTAARKGIPNVAPPEIIERLKITAANMEKVRTYLHGFAIHVYSGYRSPAVNKAVGGAAHSAHMDGWAVDFISAFGSPVDVCRALTDHDCPIKFDQIIFEYETWTHISFAPAMRRSILTIGAHTGRKYVPGIVAP